MASQNRSQPAVPSTRAIALGAISWILSLEFFAGQAVAQAAWRTPYSLVTNSISDLGNTACGTWPPSSVNLKSLGLSAQYICSPQHTVMNASFIAAGLLLLLGLFLTRSQWPRRRLATWGMALLGAAGVGKIIVGLVPENTVVLLHFLGALLGIPCGLAGILLLGLATWSTRRGVAATSLVLALTGLLGLVVTKIVTGGLHDYGLGERLAEYPIFAWLAITGLAFLLSRRPGPAPATLNTSRLALPGIGPGRSRRVRQHHWTGYLAQLTETCDGPLTSSPTWPSCPRPATTPQPGKASTPGWPRFPAESS